MNKLASSVPVSELLDIAGAAESEIANERRRELKRVLTNRIDPTVLEADSNDTGCCVV